MITRIEVEGLNGHLEYKLDFHPDLNVITGRNGSGKTSLLKLIWYAVSGNIERIPTELTFSRVRVCGKSFEVSLERIRNKTADVFKLRCSTQDAKPVEHEIPCPRWDADSDTVDQVNQIVADASGKSFFFPTFRRIEGGFAIQGWRNRRRPEFAHTDLGLLLQDYTDRMSVDDHRFIASISTDDVARLLTTQYAERSFNGNQLNLSLSKFILDEVSPSGSSSKRSSAKDSEILQRIQSRAKTLKKRTAELFAEFTMLETVIKDIFAHKGIRVADNVIFGDKKNAIESRLLSAGEKQMLSFLCYNAFNRDTMFFIDEPEISLHVDWQRQVLPTLLKQQTGNQFIVVTHSPFIYSRYPEKEIVLNSNRGGD